MSVDLFVRRSLSIASVPSSDSALGETCLYHFLYVTVSMVTRKSKPFTRTTHD